MRRKNRSRHHCGSATAANPRRPAWKYALQARIYIYICFVRPCRTQASINRFGGHESVSGLTSRQTDDCKPTMETACAHPAMATFVIAYIRCRQNTGTLKKTPPFALPSLPCLVTSDISCMCFGRSNHVFPRLPL